MDTVLADGWFSLSLAQQMTNIGNEVKRAVRFDDDGEHILDCSKEQIRDYYLRFADYIK